MDLIKASEIVLSSYQDSFLRAKIEVEDYREDIHTIVFHNDSNILNKAIKLANLIGDGHRVIKMEIIYA